MPLKFFIPINVELYKLAVSMSLHIVLASYTVYQRTYSGSQIRFPCVMLSYCEEQPRLGATCEVIAPRALLALIQSITLSVLSSSRTDCNVSALKLCDHEFGVVPARSDIR